MNRFTLVVACVASISGLAHAIDFTGNLGPGAWSGGVSSYPANIWMSQGSPDTLDFNYNFDGNWDAVWHGVTADYWVISDQNRTFSFDYEMNGYHSWIGAFASLYVFVDGPGGTTVTPLIDHVAVSGPFSMSGSVVIDVNAGYAWGLTIGAMHGDSLLGANGAVTLSNLVPAPGAGMLAGMGGLTIARRRRR